MSGPGSHVDLLLGVHVPLFDGSFVVELDLVQEDVGWFADRGSPTVRIECEVSGGAESMPRCHPRPLHRRVSRCFANGTRGYFAYSMRRGCAICTGTAGAHRFE
jgi:hypothetical protein